MNDSRNRKRLLWLAAIGGVVLLSLLFITLLAPTPDSVSQSPVIHAPGESTSAGTTTAAVKDGQNATSSGFSLGGGDLVSLALRLGLLAVIIAGSVFGLRWWGRKTTGPKSSTGFLRVVDTLAVGNGRTIHLVALGDRVIAVGATAQQLSYLNELTGEESRRVLDFLHGGQERSLGGFAAELLQSMRRDTRVHLPTQRDSVIGEDA